MAHPNSGRSFAIFPDLGMAEAEKPFLAGLSVEQVVPPTQEVWEADQAIVECEEDGGPHDPIGPKELNGHGKKQRTPLGNRCAD